MVVVNSAVLQQQVIDYFQFPPEQVRQLPNILDAGRIDLVLARELGISEPTVKRDWQRAKAFLYEALGVAP